jgi:tRNA nucleotidyltransferase (CCA-adding enzyme)
MINAADTYIRSLGLEAYRVGGSVRDEIIGREPKDADYVVRAPLETLFNRVMDTHGRPTPLKLRTGQIIGVIASPKGIGSMEIAIPRHEVSTGPGRHDFEITVDPDLPLHVDAERRDFTINAVYRDVETGKIMDPLYGVDAIKQKVLATTHPSSFRDDPLRILRALRFKSQLGFSFMERTELEMQDHADAVTGLTDKGVSGTALTELSKMLMGRRVAAALRDMRDFGIMAVLLPELTSMIGFEQDSRYHDMTTDEHTFTAIDAAAGMHCDLRVRMALLFHDAGKPECAWRGEDGRLHYYENKELDKPDHAVVSARLAREALNRLNAPKSLRSDVATLIERHMVSLSGKTRPAKVRRWRCELGDGLLADLFKHRLCDTMGKGEIDNSALMALARLEQIREDAERRHVPTSVKDLKINGNDAIEAGLKGPVIGKALHGVLHEVVSQPDEKRLSRDWQLGRLATKGRRA